MNSLNFENTAVAEDIIEEPSVCHYDAYCSESMEKLNCREELERKRRYWVVRRAQDIVLSLIAMVALFFPMLLIALVIYIDDPKGSPIFK